MKYSPRWGWWLGLLLAVPGCGGDGDAVRTGGPAPRFSLEDQDGRAIRSESLLGQFVLLNFWSTTCAACVREIPQLQALDDAGVPVVGIAVDPAGWKAVRPFVEKHRVRYRVVLGDEALFLRCDGYGLPHSLLLDPDHRVVKVYRGAVTREAVEKDVQASAREKGERPRSPG
jgi:peroxiredoxin